MRLVPWALVLTACSSVQQPETTTPSPDPPRPEVVTEVVTGVATPASRSVWDGVYTAPQASGGETAFQQVCAVCHSISEFKGVGAAWLGRASQ